MLSAQIKTGQSQARTLNKPDTEILRVLATRCRSWAVSLVVMNKGYGRGAGLGRDRGAGVTRGVGVGVGVAVAVGVGVGEPDWAQYLPPVFK